MAGKRKGHGAGSCPTASSILPSSGACRHSALGRAGPMGASIRRHSLEAATGPQGWCRPQGAFGFGAKGQGARSLARLKRRWRTALSSAGAGWPASTRAAGHGQGQGAAGQASPPGRPGAIGKKLPGRGGEPPGQPSLPGPKTAPPAPGGASGAAPANGGQSWTTKAARRPAGSAGAPVLRSQSERVGALSPSRAGRRSCPVAAVGPGRTLSALFASARASRPFPPPDRRSGPAGRGRPHGQWWARRPCHGPCQL